MKRVGVVVLALVLVLAPAAVRADVRSAAPHPSGPHLTEPKVTEHRDVHAAAPAGGLILRTSGPLIPFVLGLVQMIVGQQLSGPIQLGSSTVALRFLSVVPRSVVDGVAGLLALLPGIDAASPDLQVATDAVPNDPYYPRQTNLAPFHPAEQQAATEAVAARSDGGGPTYGIDAPALWSATTGSRNVVVAVLDGGLSPHSDLSGATVAGYDFVSDQRFSNDGDGRDRSASDPGNYSSGQYCAAAPSSWHGTHVAGIIGARRGNGIGVAGIAPGVALQPVRVVGSCYGLMSDIVAGIRWASGGHVSGVPDNATPAKVINLSLSSTVTNFACPTVYQDVIDEARSRGVLVVASAGNESSSVLSRTPANCDGVLSVGAVAPDGSPTTYTNVGSTLDMVAPGGVDPRIEPDEGIWSTVNSGTKGPVSSRYAQMSGTSMAAPTVAAAAALVFSLGDFTPDEVTETLKKAAIEPPMLDDYYTCRSVDASGHERTVCGAGILNLAAIPASTSPPVLSAGTRPGTVLTASDGVWNGGPGSVSLQWLRNGVPIAGETSSHHTISTADLGRSLTVRAVQHTSGYPDFSAVSANRSVSRASASVRPTVSTTRPVRKKTVVRVTGTVSASYGQSTSGSVGIYLGSKRLVLVHVVNGKFSAKLPVFKSRGRQKIRAWFSGNTRVLPVYSSWITVTVR